MSAKSDIIESIRGELRSQLERLASAARDAHAAATDSDSKAESKYDTRTLEASYLAKGQAKQVEEIAEQVRIFEGWQPSDFEMTAPIDAGALVEVDLQGVTAYFLLAPAAGGLTLDYLDSELTLLTPESPLYQKLLGRQVGDSFETPQLIVTEVS
jgi:transcription elongation GreA/GreB family factor